MRLASNGKFLALDDFSVILMSEVLFCVSNKIAEEPVLDWNTCIFSSSNSASRGLRSFGRIILSDSVDFDPNKPPVPNPGFGRAGFSFSVSTGGALKLIPPPAGFRCCCSLSSSGGGVSGVIVFYGIQLYSHEFE